MSLRTMLGLKRAKRVWVPFAEAAPAGFKAVDGLLWSADDPEERIAKRVARAGAGIAALLEHCRYKNVAVQAGGHIGLWPLKLSEHFAAVYTFEPGPELFAALAFNSLDRKNVIKFQAALGHENRFVDLMCRPGSSGSSYVHGEGIVPTMQIDALGLPSCDVICLDVEGSELNALRGAERTIEQFRPVIAFEDKGHSERFGTSKGEAEQWLSARLGYRVVARPDRDVIMVTP